MPRIGVIGVEAEQPAGFFFTDQVRFPYAPIQAARFIHIAKRGERPAEVCAFVQRDRAVGHAFAVNRRSRQQDRPALECAHVRGQLIQERHPFVPVSFVQPIFYAADELPSLRIVCAFIYRIGVAPLFECRQQFTVVRCIFLVTEPDDRRVFDDRRTVCLRGCINVAGAFNAERNRQLIVCEVPRGEDRSQQRHQRSEYGEKYLFHTSFHIFHL